MNYDHPIEEIDKDEVPQHEVPLVEHLMPVDLSIYDKSIDLNMISDIKLHHPTNWDEPTWKYTA